MKGLFYKLASHLTTEFSFVAQQRHALYPRPEGRGFTALSDNSGLSPAIAFS
jgi:hypothetical protein